MERGFSTPVHHTIQRIGRHRHYQAMLREGSDYVIKMTAAGRQEEVSKVRPFALGLYLFFFFACVFVVLRLVYHHEEDRPKSYEHRVARFARLKAIRVIGNSHHELVSKRTYSTGWPKASLHTARRTHVTSSMRGKRGNVGVGRVGGI